MWILGLIRSLLVFATKLFAPFSFFLSFLFGYFTRLQFFVYTFTRDSPIDAHLALGVSDKKTYAISS